MSKGRSCSERIFWPSLAISQCAGYPFFTHLSKVHSHLGVKLFVVIRHWNRSFGPPFPRWLLNAHPHLAALGPCLSMPWQLMFCLGNSSARPSPFKWLSPTTFIHVPFNSFWRSQLAQLGVFFLSVQCTHIILQKVCFYDPHGVTWCMQIVNACLLLFSQSKLNICGISSLSIFNTWIIIPLPSFFQQ